MEEPRFKGIVFKHWDPGLGSSDKGSFKVMDVMLDLGHFSILFGGIIIGFIPFWEVLLRLSARILAWFSILQVVAARSRDLHKPLGTVGGINFHI